MKMAIDGEVCADLEGDSCNHHCMSSSSNRNKVATTFICEENASSPKSAIINHPFWMPFASYGTNTQCLCNLQTIRQEIHITAVNQYLDPKWNFGHQQHGHPRWSAD